VKRYKTNIHGILKHIAHDERDKLSKYTDEELKTVAPYVLLMWIMGADNNTDARVLLTDELVNGYVFALANHKRLLLDLLCLANGYGVNTKFYFSNPQKKQGSFLVSMLSRYYNISEQQAFEDLRVHTEDDIREIGQELGLEKDEVKKLENEISKNFG
jgi:hypothetical protein